MEAAGPLAGVRVIDLTSNIMGPYASLLLADMGADVCKVESPDGDQVRGVGPARHKGMSVLFLHANRNKRSMVLDLKQPEAATAFRRMLASADVLLFSLRAKAMARLGLAYDDVRAINPRIIYCGAYGYGQQGPYADKPAYDDLIQSAVGLPILQARKTGEPQYVASPIADRVVGMATCNAVAMALYHREKTGRGQEVAVPMLETFAHFIMGDHLWGHTFSPPIGDWGYARMMDGRRRPFRTKDGYIALHMVSDRHWLRFFEAIGKPDMARDARYAERRIARRQPWRALRVSRPDTGDTNERRVDGAVREDRRARDADEHTGDPAPGPAHARSRLLPGGGSPERRAHSHARHFRDFQRQPASPALSGASPG